jgi:NADPH:quinone reductase-like Zn-dependent oxidoreductase
MGSKGRMFGIVRFLEAGRLRPVVGQVLPLEAAQEAHRLLEERRVFGKVVLQV